LLLLTSALLFSGYEVSIANSAFILRRKLSEDAKRLMIGGDLAVPVSTISSEVMLAGSESLLIDAEGKSEVSEYLTEGLLVRQLALSAQQGNAESAQLLGNHFLHTASSTMFRYQATDGPAYLCSFPEEGSSVDGEGVEDSASHSTSISSRQDGDRPSECLPPNFNDDENKARSRAALWWFSRSSAMGNYMGSLQAGLMNHFGIGTPGGQVNAHRAKRYYNNALAAGVPNNAAGTSTDVMPSSLQVVTKCLLWLVSECDESVVARGINAALGWVARALLDKEAGGNNNDM
jgi:hypothetical protein